MGFLHAGLRLCRFADIGRSQRRIAVAISEDIRVFLEVRKLISLLSDRQTCRLRRTVKQQRDIWVTSMRNAFLLRFQPVAEILLQIQSLRQQILHLLQSWEAFMYHDILDPAFKTMINRVEAEQWLNLDELIEIQESFLQTILVRYSIQHNHHHDVVRESCLQI